MDAPVDPPFFQLSSRVDGGLALGARAFAPFYQDDWVTVFHGNALEILPLLPCDAFDALITDPPYSSGGMTRSDRSADPRSKYVQSDTKTWRPSFSGDNKDGRSWALWCSLWLTECLHLVKDTGYALMFTDWRMLPLASDALQCGGFVWRGLIAWDKTEGSRAPHKGYFRHQCEYVVWGTRGVSVPAEDGPWPGCFRFPVLQSDKHHMTGKPTPLLAELVRCCPPGGVVLDPFAGSGTTLVAAKAQGRRAVGIDLSGGCCEIAARRLAETEPPSAAAQIEIAF